MAGKEEERTCKHIFKDPLSPSLRAADIFPVVALSQKNQMLSQATCHPLLSGLDFGYHHRLQGSKLKKPSGRLLATNWVNIVASFHNVNDAAHTIE